MIRMDKRWARTIPLFGLAVAALFCSRDYNPFSDLTNARARVLDWGFDAQKPYPLYSTHIVRTVVAVREQVDSFKVTAKGNRFWNDTMVRLKVQEEGISEPQTYAFAVSFYDTGLKTITIESFRSNGEVTLQPFSVRIVNLLHQNDINGEMGKPLKLLTPSVDDRDVRYVWIFGPGRSKTATACSTTVIMYDSILKGIGSLRVTDLYGKDSTPPVPFSYLFKDTTAPRIICQNGSADTILTADSIFAFRILVIDSGSGVGTCTVNGDTFDLFNSNSQSYTKLFTNAQRYTRSGGPLQLAVAAKDRAGNGAWHAYTVLFDSSGGSHDRCRINVVSPMSDPARVRTRDVWISGDVENYSSGSLEIKLSQNGVLSPQSFLIDSSRGAWRWHLFFDTIAVTNAVEVAAYGEAGQKLASVNRTIIYDPSAPDNVPPMIWAIAAADGRWRNGRLFVNTDTVTLAITAFDDGSGVDSLLVNGAPVKPDSQNGYLWHEKISGVPHRQSGATVTVHVVDRAGIPRDTVFTAIRNALPTFVSPPQIPGAFCVDSTYTCTFTCADNDFDPMQLHCTADSVRAVVANVNGLQLTLRPTSASLGQTVTLSLSLFDGYETSQLLIESFTGIDCAKKVTPVRFKPEVNVFPALLQADRDTLQMRLAIDSSPPPPGLRYSATLVNRTGTGKVRVLDNDTSSLLRWAPSLLDTGLQRLTVTVGDGITAFDSLVASIMVVHRNEYPCSLSYRFTGALGAGGELLPSSGAKPETLFVAIRDKDDPRVERYTVAITEHNVKTVTELYRKDFFITINPDSLRNTDTLLVTIRDLTGTTDSARFVIRYPGSTGPYTAWGFHKKILLNTTPGGAGTMTNGYNFPVLLRLKNSNFTFSQSRRNGQDLRFSKGDNTPLAYQIERFDSVNNLAEIWVKIDTVFANDSTHFFFMHWGNASAADAQNSRAVFDTANGFVGVWHFPAIDTFTDATTNGNLLKNSLTTKTLQAEIGYGRHFNGQNSFTSAPDQPCFNLRNEITLSAWVKVADPSRNQKIISKIFDLGNSAFVLGIQYNQLYPEFWTVPGNRATFTAGQIAANQWTHVAVTWMRGGAFSAYVNGVQVGSQQAGMNYLSSVADPVYLGMVSITSVKQFYLDGDLDEVRISSAARPANWIKLCYANQKSVDALLLFR
jgi:hypothetical protein